MSSLRSRQLVLWSLGTLTSQPRFYGTRQVTRKGRYYHPLSILPEAGCIIGFVLNCNEFVFISFFLSLYNILDFGVSGYLLMNISNSRVGKYCATQIVEYS
jgi:hypothetical protein